MGLCGTVLQGSADQGFPPPWTGQTVDPPPNTQQRDVDFPAHKRCGAYLLVDPKKKKKKKKKLLRRP